MDEAMMMMMMMMLFIGAGLLVYFLVFNKKDCDDIEADDDDYVEGALTYKNDDDDNSKCVPETCGTGYDTLPVGGVCVAESSDPDDDPDDDSTTTCETKAGDDKVYKWKTGNDGVTCIPKLCNSRNNYGLSADGSSCIQITYDAAFKQQVDEMFTKYPGQRFNYIWTAGDDRTFTRGRYAELKPGETQSANVCLLHCLQNDDCYGVVVHSKFLDDHPSGDKFGKVNGTPEYDLAKGSTDHEDSTNSSCVFVTRPRTYKNADGNIYTGKYFFATENSYVKKSYEDKIDYCYHSNALTDTSYTQINNTYGIVVNESEVPCSDTEATDAEFNAAVA